MKPNNFRWPRFAPVMIAGGLLLTSCGTSAGPAVPVPGASVGSTQTVVTAGAPDTGTDTGSGSGGYDKNRTVKENMSIRVANVYLANGSNEGTAIDVWAGSPANGGKKLMTVPYGQVSDYFAPEVPDPAGEGLAAIGSNYTVNFYPAGATSDDALLINQGEDASPGQKLTMVVSPTEPSAKGASLQIFADDIGSSPKSGGFTHTNLPKAKSGNAALLLDALAMQYRTGNNESSTGFTPSTTDGKCLPYFEPADVGAGYSGELHDMTSDVVELFGGSSYQVYSVPAGRQIRLNVLKDQESISKACADTPVFGPIDPKLTAGKGAYGLLYGPDLTTSKMLIIPVD